MDINDITPELFWNNVKKLLKERKRTLIEMEESLSLVPNSTKQWIFHKRYPSPKDTYLISQYLNTTVEYLVTGNSPDIQDRTPELIEAVESVLNSYKNNM